MKITIYTKIKRLISVEKDNEKLCKNVKTLINRCLVEQMESVIEHIELVKKTMSSEITDESKGVLKAFDDIQRYCQRCPLIHSITEEEYDRQILT